MDTFTPNKNLDQPEVGADNGTWGGLLNNDLAFIDTAFGGVTNLTEATGTILLTSTQYLPPNIIITGALTGNLVYQLPSGVGGQWSIYNATTDSVGGPWTVNFQSLAGGPSIFITRNKRVLVIADGTSNGVVLSNSVVETVPGGTSGQLQYNNSSAFGGLAGSYVSSTSITVNSVSVNSVGTNVTYTGTFATPPAPETYIAVTGFAVTSYNGSFKVVSSNSTTIHVIGLAGGADTGGTVSYSNATIGAGTVSVNALEANTVTVTGLTSTQAIDAAGNVTVSAGGFTPPSVIPRTGAPFVVDCDLSNVFTNTLNANIAAIDWTINNANEGQTINIIFTQATSPTGPFTIIWPTSFKWSNGLQGVMSNASASVCVFVATYVGGVWYCSFLASMQ
jgi:hypothetical protein